MMSSSLLIDTGVEGKNLKRVELIVSAARQLNTMINDLLILAKMQSGKMVLNLVEVDFNDLATKVVSQFATIAASKNLQLNTQLPEQSYPSFSRCQFVTSRPR
jgi:two-component system sensor histidine kinase/response regulator